MPEEVLIERVAGRRFDPHTGKIYHLKLAPPPSDEVAARCTQRSDDTVEAACRRLDVFAAHVEVVKSLYSPIAKHVDGNRDKQAVFDDVRAAIDALRA